MPTTTEKIQKLEKEITRIWQIIDDELLWDPSVIREIRRRSSMARRSHKNGSLKTAEKVFSSLIRR